MVEDLKAWRASFTEEEKSVHQAFAEFLRTNDVERDDFLVNYDSAFKIANISGDGILDKDEFHAYVDMIDFIANGIGLKQREPTKAYVDLCWQAFNGYNQYYDGVKEEDINYVVKYITMRVKQATEETDQVDLRMISMAQLADLARKWKFADERDRTEEQAANQRQPR